MNILLVYPQYPATFWSFSYALPFISKKAAVPPLGLLTVSAMLPENWQKKLVDMNISTLVEADLKWADYVFISAMYIHKASVNKIIEACIKENVKIVAGGPLFTQEYENYPEIDHFILNEAEITLPYFINDLNRKKIPDRIYQTDKYADLSKSPVPDFYLLNIKAYAFMSLQVSRGCPFSCDFCEITALLGHKVRMKQPNQILKELDALYQLNWRGPISIVDDNFIGNKKEVRNHLLPEINTWMIKHKFPFTFNVQTTINLADDEDLLNLMTDSGFNSTFIGIETPDETSLACCNKFQNNNRNLIQNIKKLQQSGMQVSGGFIVGFDSDTPRIFQRQIEFIQQSGIVSAMVGLLNAPKNTKLYNKLETENRLTTDATGCNTDYTMNFIPKMKKSDLLDGYSKIIQSIYSVKPYHKRIRQFIKNYNGKHTGKRKISFTHLLAFIKTVYVIGIKSKGRLEYWKLLIWTLFRKPKAFMDAITFTVYGYHFRVVYGLQGMDKRFR
jgi:radical SAM superfamily enzyme YgiQ (UPF0313 family)